MPLMQGPRSPAAKMVETKRIGIAVYSPEEWELLQEYSTDLESETYDEWKEANEFAKEKLRQEGHDPIDVPINVKEMQRYFDENGLENDGRNRSHYVAMKLMEMDKGK